MPALLFFSWLFAGFYHSNPTVLPFTRLSITHKLPPSSQTTTQILPIICRMANIFSLDPFLKSIHRHVVKIWITEKTPVSSQGEWGSGLFQGEKDKCLLPLYNSLGLKYMHFFFFPLNKTMIIQQTTRLYLFKFTNNNVSLENSVSPSWKTICDIWVRHIMGMGPVKSFCVKLILFS